LRLKIVFAVQDTPTQGVLVTAKCRGEIIYTDNIIFPGNDYIVSSILVTCRGEQKTRKTKKIEKKINRKNQTVKKNRLKF
jgi:hypothetical protein